MELHHDSRWGSVLMASEMRTFVFAVTFIILFGTFLSTIPTDLQGLGGSGTDISPVDPTLLSGFADSQTWQKSDYVLAVTTYFYDYNDMGGYNWRTTYTGSANIQIGAKDYVLGIAWLGYLYLVEFITNNNTNYGTTLTLDDIDNDAVDGVATYDLRFIDNGNDAGGLVVYWNSTTYSDASDAWASDGLYILHGIGITANTNVVNLLLGLMLLQLPDVPLLIGVPLAVFLWAGVIYVVWFLITSMIPLLG